MDPDLGRGELADALTATAAGRAQLVATADHHDLADLLRAIAHHGGDGAGLRAGADR